MYKHKYVIIEKGDDYPNVGVVIHHELESFDGIVFCTYEFEDGTKISECVGERYPPETFPTDKEEWKE